jgi:wobble nucleotide-excising tRNase
VDYSLLKEKVEGIEAEVKDSHDKIRVLEINQAKAEQSLTNIQSSVKDIQDTVKEIYRLISTQHTVEDKER